MLQIYKKMNLVFGFTLVIFLPIIVYSQQDTNQNVQAQLNNQMPRKSELQNMIDSSNLIVWGRVNQTESYWRTDEKGSHIYTKVTIQPVLKSLKAETVDSLEFEVVGGSSEGMTELVSNIPEFNDGEEVILFLKTSPYRLYGGHRGKMNIYGSKIFWSETELPAEKFYEILEQMVEKLSPEPIWEQVTQQYKILSSSSVPVISSISPNKASAGIDTQVTLTGSNFGAVQVLGTSKVEFFYKTGEPKIKADIISWSDTKIVCTVPIDTINGYPASAGSGPVTVTTSNGTSTGKVFRVTFSYGGYKWKDTDIPVKYYVNENTSDCTGESSAVQHAANTWNDAANTRFSFEYKGSHSNAASTRNYRNEIMWDYIEDELTIGYASQWIYDNNFTECDIVFNDNLNWSTSTSTASNKIDVETTALHELGHWLNLHDLYGDVDDGEYDVDKVMYGFGGKGITKRNLHADDIAGIQWIYPVIIQSYIDIGLRYYDGKQIVRIACEQGTPTSPLRISKNGTTYGIALVDTTDSYASGIIIQTSSGPKALRKLQ